MPKELTDFFIKVLIQKTELTFSSSSIELLRGKKASNMMELSLYYFLINRLHACTCVCRHVMLFADEKIGRHDSNMCLL